MFDQLQERLSRTLRNLRGRGKIREENIAEALTEVRTSLLEADVQYRVAQSFVDSIRQKTLGEEVVEGVDPSQYFVKAIHDELIRALGGHAAEIPQAGNRTLSILMVGLQGSGKTTTAAKLARYLRDEQEQKPFLVPADTARPAAREQLEQLGKENGFPVFHSREPRAVAVCQGAQKALREREVAANVAIFDTAGRLHVDEALMQELQEIRKVVEPDLVLYVLDAMAGQDAIQSAEVFGEKIGFDGVIVTKMDGDARGGAALSVRMATGKPIYFVGTGETSDALERLHPDRFASRILGMGDVVSLVEKAQEIVDVKEAKRLAQKIRKNQFTIEDFSDQLKAIKKMGSMEKLMDYFPGGAQMKKALSGGLPEKELGRVDAIIKSMTRRERLNHQILNGSRRKRIADGSGTSVPEVNRFLKQFLQTRTMMSRLSKGGFKGMPQGGFPPFM